MSEAEENPFSLKNFSASNARKDTSGLPPALSTTDAFNEVPVEVEKKAEDNPFSFTNYKKSSSQPPSGGAPSSTTSKPRKVKVTAKPKSKPSATPADLPPATTSDTAGKKEEANPFSFKNFDASKPAKPKPSKSSGAVSPPPAPPPSAIPPPKPSSIPPQVESRHRAVSEAWSDDDDDDDQDSSMSSTEDPPPPGKSLTGIPLPSVSHGNGSVDAAAKGGDTTGRIARLEQELAAAIARADKAEKLMAAQQTQDKEMTEALEAAVLSIEAKLSSATKRANEAEEKNHVLEARCGRLETLLSEYTVGERPDTADLVARMRAAKEASKLAAGRIREISSEAQAGIQQVMKQYKAMNELMGMLDHFDTLTILPDE